MIRSVFFWAHEIMGDGACGMCLLATNRCYFGARRQVASMEAGQEDLWQPMATYGPNCRAF